MKFCKDCKHFIDVPSFMIPQCKAPGSEEARDPVTGVRPTCKSMRLVGLLCGPKGNWFEPTEKKK